MIEALMYGMMPSEKIAQFPSAPPEKRLKSAAAPPPALWSATFWNHSRSTWALTPGVVIAAPTRMITTIPSVKSTRCLSSGILKMLAKAEIMRCVLGCGRLCLGVGV